MSQKIKLSVCIITGNEEENIRRCLESVSGWVDEIVVVDSFSTDKTVEICYEYTDRVFQHRWLGYIGQKSIARNLASNDWVLFVDADEAVSDKLKQEILQLFEKGAPTDAVGYDFPRQVWFLNRWIRHGDWYPDTKLRLFKKSCGHCCGCEPHERIDVDGVVHHLKSPLYHYTYDDIRDQLNTLNRFSSISADGVDIKKKKSFAILFGMFFHSPFRFFRCYFIKCGFMDGMPGLIIATTAAFGTFVKYAKLWERRLNASTLEKQNK